MVQLPLFIQFLNYKDGIYGLTSMKVRNRNKNKHTDSHEKYVPNKALNHFMQPVIQTYLTVIQIAGIVLHTEKNPPLFIFRIIGRATYYLQINE